MTALPVLLERAAQHTLNNHANEEDTVSQILPYQGPAPDHVPAELLTEFNLFEHPGIQVDPYGTLAEVARTYPRVFYTTHNRQRKEPGSVDPDSG